jgi:hypothetical protein
LFSGIFASEILSTRRNESLVLCRQVEEQQLTADASGGGTDECEEDVCFARLVSCC